ncbi:unnamed protein product [Pleuronectes platessa]|uniref:Uncharacterized protein n=1 Tax=Pleuronectes platessa TaxID=8262 RepID=A0A9N7TRH1_PLEPL|nr:unnamed protein product [Pleuronectes platessa]
MTCRHVPDHLVIFSFTMDSISLPCGISSIKSCSSVNLSMVGEFGWVTEVVRAGRVSAPSVPRLGLLQDCSLEINRPGLNDARLYSCDSGALRSSVSRLILQLSERTDPAEEMPRDSERRC